MTTTNLNISSHVTSIGNQEHLLTLDVGNSTIVASLMNRAADVVASVRIHTEKEEGEDYYVDAFSRFLNGDGRGIRISSVVLSSVVPELNDCIASAVRIVTGVPVHIVDDESIRSVICLDVDKPEAVGKDRVCDAIGAMTLFSPPFIVIDMGTATTVNVVDASGCFIGGMIIPGVRTSHEALSHKASQLPDVPIKAPAGIIGKNTVHCMQSGIVYGYASMIDGIIDRIAHEMNIQDCSLPVVATGGMAHIIVPHCLHHVVVDRYLQQKGMCKIVNFI